MCSYIPTPRGPRRSGPRRHRQKPGSPPRKIRTGSPAGPRKDPGPERDQSPAGQAAHKAPEPQETPRGISGQEPGRPAAVYIPFNRRNAPRNHGSSHGSEADARPRKGPGTQTAPRPPEDTRSPGTRPSFIIIEEPRPAADHHSCFLSRSIFSEIACFI